jgi:SAM-dependent methyltransferase
VAVRHREPRHPPVLRRLTDLAYFQPAAARWYGAEYSWKTDDVPFYLRLAQECAGSAGSVLELAAGEGRVALPLARAGFRVTALDRSPEMLGRLRARLGAEPEEVGRLVELVEQDLRGFALDRLYRLIYLPFNTLLTLSTPPDRFRALERVREHLAPSGAFAFEVFTPDPRRLVEEPDWVVELEFETEDAEAGTVHVLRERRRAFDFAAQTMHVEFRHRIARGDEELAAWEDSLDIAYIFPRELELLLERQGLRIRRRYGGGDFRAYSPTADDVQAQFVVAEIAP